jgi:hypothetical protein
MSELKGIDKLKAAVEKDQKKSPNFHDYYAKLDWVIERAKHYQSKTGVPYLEIINKWEENRDYWYMNYYQDSNQPLLTDENVHVFDTVEDFKKAVGTDGFYCPKCGNISKSPYDCLYDKCDWKSYGFFKTMGKGVFVFIKNEMLGNEIFEPVKFRVKS